MRHCLSLGIFGLMKPNQVFQTPEGPLLNGAFGVSKNKKVPGTTTDIQRLIINLIPANAILEDIAGDIRTLPFASQGTGVNVLDDQTIMVFSDEDLTCAFYLFALPDAWMEFQCLNKPVSGKDVADLRPDLAQEPILYPAVRVIPMGWTSACGVLQYLHRRMVGEFGPRSAGLPHSLELRKDRPAPRMHPDEDNANKYWGIYIDNFMETELIHLDRLSAFEEPTEWQAAVRKAYEAHDVLGSSEKTVSKKKQIERLGSMIDGEFGAASTPNVFDLRLISLTMWMLRWHRPSQNMIQILGGRWVRKMLHRRETLCIFRSFWEYVATGTVRRYHRQWTASS